MEKRKLGRSGLDVAPIVFGGNVFGWSVDQTGANKLLDQLYDFDVNGNKKALRPIRVPTLKEQKSRRLCRMRSQLIKVRNILEAQGRGLLFDFDFHDVPQGWWGPRKWPKLRAKLHAHDPWLVGMLEHHQRLLGAQQQRIAELDSEIAQESNYDGGKVAKGLGPTTFASLQREAIRIHLPIIGKRAAVVEEKAALLSQSAVTLRRVATSIQFTPCSTAMNPSVGLVGSLQGIELFH